MYSLIIVFAILSPATGAVVPVGVTSPKPHAPSTVRGRIECPRAALALELAPSDF
jgi:hypothetical protein